ncbi:MAG TPA: 2-oxo-4-hydroxy-4-carboxy-5-ureidoimidazoline decarboxylase [Candidatus Eisenbacteria bacterium]|jgi:2-oxo-4-hydroxy-4-carboxy-5-ureidoimidazoline decarboxylase
MTLARLNALDKAAAREALERCCGSKRWVQSMCAARPFRDRDALNTAAGRAFGALEPEDWLEAFAYHPRIGDLAWLRDKYGSTAAWAAEEQRGAAAANQDTLEALAEANRAYEERFGYIFIVCATGKSAEEMLALLMDRMPHPPSLEIMVAAKEQMKITGLRIDKLLESPS